MVQRNRKESDVGSITLPANPVHLTLCGSYAQKVFPGRGRAGVWAAAGAAAVWKLCGLHINPIYLLLAGTVFWVVVPLLAQGLGKIKKS